MPPKARITKEMIVEEAFQIARTQGADKITARGIARRLKCSTQPVLYYFATVEEIKEAVYQRADAYHTRFLLGAEGDGMLGIGLRYVRFAAEERNLFHLLFQPGAFSGASLNDLVSSEELNPIIQALRQETGVTEDAAREIFSTLFVFVHGYASLLANNEMKLEEDQLELSLKKVFLGAVYAEKERENEENL
ncbi:MAG TPA: TetR family transcriptional regulator [Clostridiales bacterium]|nr:TetR family transcriptional regulator [Clostridiales bacterium]